MGLNLFSSNFYTFYMNSTMSKMATQVFEKYDENKDDTITRDEFTGTKEAFSLMDKDSDGKITSSEIKDAFELNPVSTPRSNILENVLRDSFLHQIQKKDKNSDNVLSLEEYGGENKDFNRIDKDQNGKITADEMRKDYLKENPNIARLISKVDSMNMLLDALSHMGRADFYHYF